MKRPPRISKRRRGFTLMEAMTASLMTVLVIAGAVGTMLAGLQSWSQGTGLVESEMDAQQGMRAVVGELREAMAITVDADGKGVTYRLPQKNGSGEFITPALWDGVSRRISIVANTYGRNDLNIGVVGNMTKISRNIVLQDPIRLNVAYIPFVAGPGTIKRSITITFVSNALGSKERVTYSRNRELLYLRNVPALTK